jgi:ubiquinone/menaquinone biosynthesis C-methylase UbiE
MKSPIEFYKELSFEKLLNRKKDYHTKKELKYLKYFLHKKERILDLGCGYGRFTIPLKKSGYDIIGLDISPYLINIAKNRSKEQNIKVNFKLGDMRKLPFKNNSFDSTICMSAFSELVKVSDQIKSITEIYRILKKSGIAIIELPMLSKKKVVNKELNFSYRIIGRISHAIINDIETNPFYVHDKTSLKNLMKKTKIKSYSILNESYGGRMRLFLIIYKEK